jgi:hypothetical protein
MDESGDTLQVQRMGKKALSTILRSSSVESLYAIISFSFFASLVAKSCHDGHTDKDAGLSSLPPDKCRHLIKGPVSLYASLHVEAMKISSPFFNLQTHVYINNQKKRFT